MVQLADACLSQETALLAIVEQSLQNELRRTLTPVGAIYLHMTQGGGKRIRPGLILACNRLYSPDCGSAIPVAVAAELIHMASMAHDDVIDQADMRRGLPTVNHHWDSWTAVLVGDALLARALGLLVETRQPGILRLMADMLKEMCEGEISQNRALLKMDLSEAEYLNCIQKKTALFFAVCCQSGALLGGCPSPDAQALWQYGYRLGMAFQMIDDLLDVNAKPETWGKPIGADVAAGVMTLPLIRAMQDPKYGKEIRKQVLTWRSILRRAKRGRRSTARRNSRHVQQLLALIQATDALEYTRRRAQEYARSAIGCIPANTDPAAKARLTELVDSVVHRQS
ncbi:MAG TPA: polyprenyl synthetase family protein [Firmicutes bacterium]|jgi:heptaprenyl diphosphate synthase|nr:polyprenyl synthetase family protein [Bacillota bacterium]